MLLWSEHRRLDSSLLGQLPGARAAFSVRKVGRATNIPMRVQRTSDNAEVDVYFDTNDIISMSSTVSSGGTLSSWVGGNSAKVAIWYDQTGNGLHAANNVLSARPHLVMSGVLQTQNSKASIFYDNVNRDLAVPDNDLLDINDELTILGVIRHNDYNFIRSYFDKRDGAANSMGYHLSGFTGAVAGFQMNDNTVGTNLSFNAIPLNTYSSYIIRAKKADSADFYHNTTDRGSASFLGIPTGSLVNTIPLSVGGHSTNTSYTLRGYYGEFILYARRLSDTERSLYATNSKNFFGF